MQGGGNGGPQGRAGSGFMSRENIGKSMQMSPFWQAKAAHEGGKFDFNRFGWGRDGQTAQGMGAGDQTPAQGPIIHDPGAPDVPGPIETGPGNVVQPGPNIGPSDYGQGENEKKSRWINALQGEGYRSRHHRWKGY